MKEAVLRLDNVEKCFKVFQHDLCCRAIVPDYNDTEKLFLPFTQGLKVEVGRPKRVKMDSLFLILLGIKIRSEWSSPGKSPNSHGIALL